MNLGAARFCPWSRLIDVFVNDWFAFDGWGLWSVNLDTQNCQSYCNRLLRWGDLEAWRLLWLWFLGKGKAFVKKAFLVLWEWQSWYLESCYFKWKAYNICTGKGMWRLPCWIDTDPTQGPSKGPISGVLLRSRPTRGMSKVYGSCSILKFHTRGFWLFMWMEPSLGGVSIDKIRFCPWICTRSGVFLPSKCAHCTVLTNLIFGLSSIWWIRGRSLACEALDAQMTPKELFDVVNTIAKKKVPKKNGILMEFYLSIWDRVDKFFKRAPMKVFPNLTLWRGS